MTGNPLVVGVGAVQRTVTVPTPRTAVGVPGASGTVPGATCCGTVGLLVPAAFTASTTNAYVAPLVSPPMVHESAVDLHVAAPGVATAT